MRTIDEIRKHAEHCADRADYLWETQSISVPEKVIQLADVVEGLADDVRDIAILVKNLQTVNREALRRIGDLE